MFSYPFVSGVELPSVFNKDIESWCQMVGSRIRHKKFGWGKVKEVTKYNVSGIQLIMLFDNENGERIFSPLTFKEGYFSEVEVSESIYRDILKKREQEQELLLELQKVQKSREHFCTLKRKYGLESVSETDPLSFIYLALLRMDEGEDITKNKELIERLRNGGYFEVLAVCYHQAGVISTAGSYWRKAGNPKKALEISEAADCQNNSRILTMRGGAFRDEKSFSEAKICAQSAIGINPKSFYPYNLLGAIAFDEKDYEAGMEYFERAVELGSDGGNDLIKNYMKKSTSAEKQNIAEFLYSRDPQKYSWAKEYLFRSGRSV